VSSGPVSGTMAPGTPRAAAIRSGTRATRSPGSVESGEVLVAADQRAAGAILRQAWLGVERRPQQEQVPVERPRRRTIGVTGRGRRVSPAIFLEEVDLRTAAASR